MCRPNAIFSATFQVREQRIALEHGVDLTLVGRNIVQALAVEEYIAGIRLLKAADDAQCGRFAAAGRTEQGHELAALDGQRNAAQYGRSVKFFFQVLQIDQDFDSILITLPKQVAAPNRAGQARFGVALYIVANKFLSYNSIGKCRKSQGDTQILLAKKQGNSRGGCSIWRICQLCYVKRTS